MTRFARVGEGRKRPLDATEWKDMKKKKAKKSKTDPQTQVSGKQGDSAGTPVKSMNTVTTKEPQKSHHEQFLDTDKSNEQSVTVDPNTAVEKVVDETKDVNTDSVKKDQSSEKKQKQDRKSKRREEMECYNCHKKGHKVSDCPEPSDGKMADVQCYKCKQKGHKSFKCPNSDNSIPYNKEDKKPKFQNPNQDFDSFKRDFKYQWDRKTGFKKALREAWKSRPKDEAKNYNQFKLTFLQEWSKKTGYNKALREAWKVQGKDLKQELRRKERSEQRRVMRIDQRESEKHCFNCRGSGHVLSECPELNKDLEQGTGICFKCGSTEHAVAKCTVKVPEGEFPYAKCFICSETGHLSKQCPDNPRGLYPNGGCCKVCASVEHLKKDCPEMQKKQGIGSVMLTTMDASRSGDWEDIKQRKPWIGGIVKKPAAGPKVVKF